MAQETTPPLPTHMRRALQREFTKFFTRVRTPAPNWKAMSDQEFIDALADSLIESGRQSGMGVAHLQTLVHELQDRINNATQGS